MNTTSILLVTDKERHPVLKWARRPENPWMVKQTPTLSESLHVLKTLQFDAVLLEPQLPDATRLWPLERIQMAAPMTPVILLCGEDGDWPLEAIEKGAQDILHRDELNPDRITRTIRYAIERKQAQGELARLAHHDALTGLANRTLFRDMLSHAMARARRREERVALLFLDLDRFKRVNDTLGHDSGDLLLRLVAQRLEACVREAELVSRLGGDEFTILLEGITDRDEIDRVVNRIHQQFQRPFDLDGREIFASASIGVATFPDQADTADLLRKRADWAMYQAKRLGRNRCHFFVPHREREAERLELENDLRGALDRQEFVLRYEPRFDLVTGRVEAVEALLRWDSPSRGLVSPADFVPILEETGWIVPVGEWVLHTACAQATAWQRAGLPPVRMAVNVSARQFRGSGLEDAVFGALERADLAPSSLELELTESLLLEETETIRQSLQSLDARGVRISIDDFGTGYSSLAYLHEFPISILKIDRTFIRKLTEEHGAVTLTRAIIGLGQSLGLHVVAEGIETFEQLAILREHSCHSIQGHLLARPIPGPQLPEWLETHQPHPLLESEQRPISKKAAVV